MFESVDFRDLLIRCIVAGVVVAVVTVLAKAGSTRVGALVLTLPIVSLIAFISTWQNEQDMTKITSLSRDALVLVPLGLPFFVPLAFAKSWGLSFWPAFAIGVGLASIAIAAWMIFGPKL